MPLLLPPPEKSRSRSAAKRKKKESDRSNSTSEKTGCNISIANLLLSDRYLSEILSKKISTQRDHREGALAFGGRIWKAFPRHPRWNPD
ncbi:hypothetical protein ACS0TY_021963 [Phlomoides rotata]